MRIDLHRSILLVCVLVLVAGCLVHIAFGYSDINRSQHAWGSDDAYISYRYAKNLGAGQGLVFNPGERVEGYSNFAYVLLLTLGIRLLDSHFIYLFSAFINVLCLITALFVFHAHVKHRLGDTYGSIGTLLMAVCLPLWLWVASGLETPLVLLVQLIVCYTLDLTFSDQRWLLWLCLTLVASMFVRADGFVLPVLVVIYCLLQRRWRIAVFSLVTIAITMGFYTAWRYGYYGDLLPNTFYAKVSGDLFTRVLYALVQLSDIIMHDGMFMYGLVFFAVFVRLMAVFISRRHNVSKLLTSSMFFALGWLCYWLFIGGDVYYDRFLIILFPLGMMTTLEGLRSIDSNWQQWRSRLLIVTLISVQLAVVVTDPRFMYSRVKYDSWLTLGAFLERNYADKILAVDAAGKMPYLSNQVTIDMLGLNDRYIAREPAHDNSVVGHTKFDVDYVLSKSPDLIITWIDRQLDMNYGFDRATYLAAGYRLTYLLYVADKLENAEAGAIVDVSNIDDSQTKRLVESGYNYAVLSK